MVLATDMGRHKLLVGEFQSWVEELAGGSVGAGVFLRQGDSARGLDALAGGGAHGGGGSMGELSFGGERADRAPALVRARRLDRERREALLVICMKCADLSSLVMDLPRADFWGYRIMMENLKQGERESRERVERTTPTTREGALANYFAHQAGFLEHVVLPDVRRPDAVHDRAVQAAGASAGGGESGGLAKGARRGDDDAREPATGGGAHPEPPPVHGGVPRDRGVHHQPRHAAAKEDERHEGRVSREPESLRGAGARSTWT